MASEGSSLPADSGNAATDYEYDKEESSEYNSVEDLDADGVADANDNVVASDINPGEVVSTLNHLHKAIAGLSKLVKGQGTASEGARGSSSLRGRGRSGRGGGRSRATSGSTGSRFNSKYFARDIVGKLSDRHKEIVVEKGFSWLLEYDGCYPSRPFVQWIADQIDLNCYDIVRGDRLIPYSPQAVHCFLGSPVGGQDIKALHNDNIKKEFLKKIDKDKLPLVKDFGTELMAVPCTLSDDNVFRYFMVLALSTFLCSNSSTLPSPQYLGPLIDVDSTKDWDWSKLIFECLFSSIRKYRQFNRGTIGGCIYFLAGYYLGFVEFGYLYERESLFPDKLPRMLVWKGDMIGKFASYDRVAHNIYGKRPVKRYHETCYDNYLLPEDASVAFKDILDERCDFISPQDRAEVCGLFDRHHKLYGYKRPGILVGKVFCHMHRQHGREISTDDAAVDASVGVDSSGNIEESVPVDTQNRQHKSFSKSVTDFTIAFVSSR